MEPEEEETLPTQPFWLQNADHLRRRRLRRSYSLLLTSASFLVLLLVTALTLAFIVVPTLHSFASHIFKPHTIKNSWDSLNLILVIFAIACAFLTKNTTTEPETPLQRSFSNLPQQDHYVKQNSIPSRTWCEHEYPQRTNYNKSLSRLRSFNSYPDLRQESSWITTEERWRFCDDTLLDSRRQPRREEEEAKEETVIETVATATSKEVASPPPQPPPSSPPRRSKAVRRNIKRTQQAEIIEKPSTPPPPPPPPVTAEMKTVQGKKRRKSATKEFLTSLTGKKKKKQRNPSVEDSETILILNSEPFHIASQPLPEPHPIFQNLFSSKKSQHKTKRHPDPVAIHKPASSNKRERFYSLEEKNDVVITGNESPLIPIPPPPPPFRLPAWKFRVQGDFVRVDSIGSSGSSAVEEVAESPVCQEGSQCNSPCDPHGGGESVGSLFCPSPDVDTKAHSFIERFRAGLRMEKMNSMKEKQGIGRSSLGSSSTSPITKQETTPS